MADKLDPDRRVIQNTTRHATELAQEVFVEQKYEPRDTHEIKLRNLAHRLGLPEGCIPAGIATAKQSDGTTRECLMVKRKEGDTDALYSIDLRTGKIYQRFESDGKGYVPTETGNYK